MAPVAYVVAIGFLAMFATRFIAGNVLDLPSCTKGIVTKDIAIQPHDSLVIKKSRARTLVECAISCLDSSAGYCTGALWREEDGKCYELGAEATDVEYEGENTFASGQLVEFLTSSQHGNCSGRACASHEVCIESCVGGEMVAPVCVANQRQECDLAREYDNLRYYWSDVSNNDLSTGTVMIATYPKERSGSGLRVIIHMAGRGHLDAPGECTHWFVTFDGEKCNSPENIETVDYSAQTGNHHRVMDIDGTCYGLKAGDRRIELVVDKCKGYGYTYVYTGWNSASTMMVMEMVPPTPGRSNKCPHLNVFNYHYETWNEEFDQEFNLTEGGRLVKAVSYEKMADDTSLHIKYSAVTGVIISDIDSVHCGRWYILIDGVKCDPFLDFVLRPHVLNLGPYWMDHRRTRTVEGICDNDIPAGTHTVEVWVGDCDAESSQPTRVVAGGFNSPSRLHVEEVRRDQAVDGVRSRREMYKSHSGNLGRYYWWRPNADEADGDIFTLTYVKEFADTGLKLTSSGLHRSYLSPGSGGCARWFFKIDDIECTEPGRIEGIISFDHPTYNHSPMQVSGVCHGIPRGNHTITYAVGSCAGYSPGDPFTGWESSFHIFIEELRLESFKVCSEDKPIDCDI